MTTESCIALSLTHKGYDLLGKEEISCEFNQIKERLTTEFKNDTEKLALLLQILEELSQFELGRFLIKNKSLSGYWTWYIILGFQNQLITSPLEKFIVTKAPTVLATQQRFAIFQSLLIKHIHSHSSVCSIPCGMMADLLTLNLPQNIQEVRLVGIDLDSAVFELAKALAKKLNVRHHYEFFKKDAWHLNIEEQFDVITSNGLNIYEKDDSKVIALYREMYLALKNQGHFICSALTLPPTLTHQCEWDMRKINSTDLATASLLFKNILQTTWANFRSSEKTCQQLQEAGFKNIEIIWDKQRMFPTFLAQKI